MKARTILLGTIVTLAAPLLSLAANIDRATITEVVNNVRVIEPASKKTSAAQVKQAFNAPNVLRTGPDSRAEMVSEDQTVTRVGQNTVFSFQPESREIDLQKGSILFQSPSGKGGGTIRTPAASAAVLGTTLVVTATQNGGFKVLLIEGKGRVKSGDGSVRTLAAGNMVYALPGGRLSNVFEFRLSQQVGASKLVSGFKKQLPSAGKIQAAIRQQELDLASGKALDSGLLASGSPNFAYKVDVARDTIVEQQSEPEVPVSPLAAAGTSDAIISAPNLDPERLFTTDGIPGAKLFGPEHRKNGVIDSALNPIQFIGSNILFDTPTVNLMPYVGHDLFQFLALNDVLFNQSVDLGHFNGQIQFLAGGTFQAPLGTSVMSDSERLTFIAVGSSISPDQPLPGDRNTLSLDVPLRLTDFSAKNTLGAVDMAAGQMELSAIRISAGTDATLYANQDILITGAGAQVGVSSPDGAADPSPLIPKGYSRLYASRAVLAGAQRDVILDHTATQGKFTQIVAGRAVKLNAVQLFDRSTNTTSPNGAPSTAPISGQPTVHIYGNELVAMNKVNFFASDVLVQSRTIALNNVNFKNGSRVLLESQIGTLAPNPNTGVPPIPGRVNFVRNVTYGGASAQSFVIQNGAAPTPAGPGIVIRPYRGTAPQP